MADQSTDLLTRRHDALGNASPLFYDRPLELVRGEGVWVFDADGNRYLDCYNNVPHVGHCHPHVVAAVTEQIAKLNLNTRYLHENVVAYAERLSDTVEIDPAAVMFTCTGTEANEVALRMAAFHTGARGVIVSDFSYHGNSRQLAALTSCFETPEPFPAWARAVRVPDPWRDRDGRSDAEIADAFEADVKEAIASLDEAGFGISAMLIDPSFANEGLPEMVPGLVAKAANAVRAAGGIVIFDEVQSGFGRTGQAMWSHQLCGVKPDIVTMGKPMGNGFPIGGAIAPRAMVDKFEERSNYFNTFGGNPVAAAAGSAVLDVIENESLMQRAADTSQHIVDGLEQLKARHGILGNVRSRGMFFGLDIVKPDDAQTPDGAMAKRVVEGMKNAGVLLGRIGRDDNVLKLRPMMVFTKENADFLLERIDQVLGEVA